MAVEGKILRKGTFSVENATKNIYFVYWSATSVRDIIFFSVECGIARFLCAMRLLTKISILWRFPCIHEAMEGKIKSDYIPQLAN